VKRENIAIKAKLSEMKLILESLRTRGIEGIIIGPKV
jgi:hypothetical protein